MENLARLEKGSGLELEQILLGPLLSDSLADVSKQEERFEATSSDDQPDRKLDGKYRAILGTLRYAASRIGKSDAQNRIGRDIVENFQNYGNFAGRDPINPKLLDYLAAGIRSSFEDPNLAASLGALDLAGVKNFIGEHEALIQNYFSKALSPPHYETSADPDTLNAELFPKLDEARRILTKVYTLFAPSVSDALEIPHRRAEGAKRYITAASEEERQRAVEELRRNSVLTTAYLGWIKGRLTQWLDKQAQYIRENRAQTTATLITLAEAAKGVVIAITPLFNSL